MVTGQLDIERIPWQILLLLFTLYRSDLWPSG